jgi:hypothetical protein
VVVREKKLSDAFSKKINKFGSGVDDRHFQRFSQIFGEKIGVFLENQCHALHNLAVF